MHNYAVIEYTFLPYLTRKATMRPRVATRTLVIWVIIVGIIIATACAFVGLRLASDNNGTFPVSSSPSSVNQTTTTTSSYVPPPTTTEDTSEEVTTTTITTTTESETETPPITESVTIPLPPVVQPKITLNYRSGHCTGSPIYIDGDTNDPHAQFDVVGDNLVMTIKSQAFYYFDILIHYRKSEGFHGTLTGITRESMGSRTTLTFPGGEDLPYYMVLCDAPAIED